MPFTTLSSPTAMLLAAGRGKRMRPLTDSCPKPLLRVQGKPLMQWHLEALARGGVSRVVINTAWLEEQIAQQFNDVFVLHPNAHKAGGLAAPAQVQICYSHEGHDFGGALETAGGIARALALLCPAPAAGLVDQAAGSGHRPYPEVFWVLAGDVFAPTFQFTQAAVQRFIARGCLAHLWLVPNPAHHPRGDFGLDLASGLALNLRADDPRARFTYSSIGLYRRALFEPPWCSILPGNPLGIKAALAPLLRAAMDGGLVSAEVFDGAWTDVGTPERLAQLNATS